MEGVNVMVSTMWTFNVTICIDGLVKGDEFFTVRTLVDEFLIR